MPVSPPLRDCAPDLFGEGIASTISGSLRVEPEAARSILRPQRDDRYGFGYALSPYRGCAHGCAYCYVRDYPNAQHGPDEWGRWSAPKLNAPELLWGQRHKLHGKTVFLASATDPYQPLEREFRLTRGCLEVLLECPTTRVILHTRSGLVLQDLDLLKRFGDRLAVGLSVNTDDDTVRQVVEPKAPPIPSRWLTLERLARAGISVTLAATPLLPMLDPQAFARRARQSGAKAAWVGGLRLLKNDPFYEVLARHGWLRALDKDYQAEVREVLRQEFPGRLAGGKGPREPIRKKLIPLPPAPLLMAPGLFDGL